MKIFPFFDKLNSESKDLDADIGAYQWRSYGNSKRKRPQALTKTKSLGKDPKDATDAALGSLLFVSSFISKIRNQLDMIQFQIYVGQDKLWHWRLLAANGQNVCWSEGYDSKQSAEYSVNWVKINAPTAKVVYL